MRERPQAVPQTCPPIGRNMELFKELAFSAIGLP